MGELAEFEDDVEESSTDWGEVYRAHAQRKRQIDIMDDRSEGEVGPPVDDDGESIGEILDDAAKVNNILGKKLPQPSSSRYNAKLSAEKTKRSALSKPTPGSRSKYEGGLGYNNATGSLEFEDFDDSGALPGPIRDSGEEPKPINKKKTNGKSQVLMSGESFGGKNPLVGSSGGGNKIKNAKQSIPENFLEDGDDYSDNFDN